MHLSKLTTFFCKSVFITASSKIHTVGKVHTEFEYTTLRICIKHMKIFPATSMYNPQICIFLNMRACSIKNKTKTKNKINLTGSVFAFRPIKWWEYWVFFQLLPSSFAGKDGVSVPSRWADGITPLSCLRPGLFPTLFLNILMNCFLLQRHIIKTKN